MNKIICSVLGIIIICSSFIGCGNTTDNFIDPVEQTNDSLGVYLPDSSGAQLSEIVKDFTAYRPDIKLTVYDKEYYGVDTYEEMETKVVAEILAGGGPDIFCIDGRTFDDVNKVMKSGVFYDINQLIKSDPDFNRADYHEVALKAGEYDGKQLVFPTGIDTPMLLTSQRALEQTGFDLEKCKTPKIFWDEMNRYIGTRTADDNRFAIAPTTNTLYSDYVGLFHATDYNNSTVEVDTKELKSLFTAAKRIDEINSENEFDQSFELMTEKNYFKNDQFLFYLDNMGYYMLDLAALINEYSPPVLYPTYNSEGKIQSTIASGIAINAKSKNKQTAYEFLKIGLDWEREAWNKDELEKLYAKIKAAKDVPPEQYLYMRSVYLPVVKSRLENDISLIKKNFDRGLYYNEYDVIFSDDGINIKIKPLPESFYEEFKDIYNNIEVCTLASPANKKVVEYVRPYLDGKKSLEACLKQAQDQLEIYISE